MKGTKTVEYCWRLDELCVIKATDGCVEIHGIEGDSKIPFSPLSNNEAMLIAHALLAAAERAEDTVEVEA